MLSPAGSAGATHRPSLCCRLFRADVRGCSELTRLGAADRFAITVITIVADYYILIFNSAQQISIAAEVCRANMRQEAAAAAATALAPALAHVHVHVRSPGLDSLSICLRLRFRRAARSAYRRHHRTDPKHQPLAGSPRADQINDRQARLYGRGALAKANEAGAGAGAGESESATGSSLCSLTSHHAPQ